MAALPHSLVRARQRGRAAAVSSPAARDHLNRVVRRSTPRPDTHSSPPPRRVGWWNR
jgi:hypothetical protein